MAPPTWLPRGVRAAHRGQILRLIDEYGPMTRSALADQTGLSVPAIGSIVSELVSAGCLVGAGPARQQARGPRAQRLAIAAQGFLTAGIGIEIGRIEVALCDLSANVISSTEVTFDPRGNARTALDIASWATATLIRTAPAPVVGIGVAAPGSVDAAGRLVREAFPLRWHDIPVADHVENALGYPTTVDFNVRAMALAETRHGLARSADSLLYAHVGAGVGIALVAAGKVVRHGDEAVPELGHHSIRADGPACACGGAGCLEALIAEPYLGARVRSAAQHSRILDRSLRENTELLHVLDAASKAGDPAGVEILGRYITDLASGLAMAVNVLSPARVVLGGMLGTAPKDLIERISISLRRKVCRPLRGRLTVGRSTIETSPAAIGGAAIALERFFFAAGPRLDKPHTPPSGYHRGEPARGRS